MNKKWMDEGTIGWMKECMNEKRMNEWMDGGRNLMDESWRD